ncbi:DUF1439 domain-containing protein [Methylotenera sp.]|uniref:DUF1439 domain-containing protein n=1 Tax=Methylotenera sp. TaxID=2051956 RepID=UPI0027306C4C|nr:DUF1439 domain-containing protein [Methylotenera sp.]MDP2070167.1 DUF1439 domain-containing protein [Methylotenera sp.]MDP3006527.1 DUF1439 domain-containing protein [Methylotenera sp.]
MKFKLFNVLLFAVIFTGCATLSDRTVNVTEVQLQQKLNERLATPISLLKIFDVNLSNSIVKFDGKTGRMITRLDASLTSLLSDKALAGKLDISGKLRFDAATNSVVLDDPKVESLNLDGLDAKQGEFFNLLAQRLGGEMLNGLSLYTVKPEDLKLGSTQYNPKAMQITDSGLQITFSPVR